MKALTNVQITAMVLNNGFKLKVQPDGALGLNPCVFEFARALLQVAQVEAQQVAIKVAQDMKPQLIEQFQESYMAGAKAGSDLAVKAMLERQPSALPAVEQEPVAALRDAAAVHGFALVPFIVSRVMQEAMDDEGWNWEDLLAAAASVTESQYDAIANARPQLSANDAPAEWLKWMRETDTSLHHDDDKRQPFDAFVAGFNAALKGSK